MNEPILASPDVVRYIVDRFGLRMNKRLGQNFLIRRSVVDAIAEAADLKEGDPVLEIGPGIGTLTQALAETGAAVTAVELDEHLLPVLAKTLEHYPNVRVVHGDILRIDIDELMDVKIAGDRECISCGKCQTHCRTQAIYYRNPIARTNPTEVKGE